jgi:DnaJ like chaperone protein
MIGALIGAILGFKTGHLFGAMIGGYIGYLINDWFSKSLSNTPENKSKIQQQYFKTLFITLGRLAKADGVVTKDEIRKCELIMHKMQLSEAMKKKAIDFFNTGKQPNFNVGPILNEFNQVVGGSYSIKQMFMEMLLEVASAENRINSAEWTFLTAVCRQLRFPEQLFVALAKMRGFNFQSGHQHSGAYSNQTSGSYNSNKNQYQKQQNWTRNQQLDNPYQKLGVQESDTKLVIRRAYKKLMSTHHPDKLIAKGLPPEMIEIAKNKTQEIQAAWEDIKSRRGF